jgi:spermidine synthase
LKWFDSSGLGVGITAKSFHDLGIRVTSVEIDPIVHRFAEKYFGLPRLDRVVYRDGRAFIEKSATIGEKWDFIVHDVFTGGSVPPHLFTLEMWTLTKAVLASHGVLAVVHRLCEGLTLEYCRI